MAGSSTPRASHPPTWTAIFKQWQACRNEVDPHQLLDDPFVLLGLPGFAARSPVATVHLDWWKPADLSSHIAQIRQTGFWRPTWDGVRPGEGLTLQTLWDHRGSQQEMAIVWLRTFCRQWLEHMPPFKGDFMAHHRVLQTEILSPASERVQPLGMRVYPPGNIKYFLPDDLPDWKSPTAFHPKTWRDFVRIIVVCAHAAVTDWTPVALLPLRNRDPMT